MSFHGPPWVSVTQSHYRQASAKEKRSFTR
jgi:hypothetical protein